VRRGRVGNDRREERNDERERNEETVHAWTPCWEKWRLTYEV
jgi:hypothetical protein